MDTRHAGQKVTTGTKRAREGYGCAQFVGSGMKWTLDQRVQPREVTMLRFETSVASFMQLLRPEMNFSATVLLHVGLFPVFRRPFCVACLPRTC